MKIGLLTYQKEGKAVKKKMEARGGEIGPEEMAPDFPSIFGLGWS